MPHFYGTTHSRERRDYRSARTIVRTEPAHDEIARLAYSYWESRGCQDGSSLEDWLRAERELRDRSGPQFHR
jgi:hypothetical protein